MNLGKGAKNNENQNTVISEGPAWASDIDLYLTSDWGKLGSL